MKTRQPRVVPLAASDDRIDVSERTGELGWHPDLIELQLAHAERDEARAAYNRAQRLPERRTMMQTWADYLDRLRADSLVNVVLESSSVATG
jgi:hypothetical protein